ncbi:MAG: hypothetical protein OEX07_04735, partial [Gammaproteobacteria bacterium]|nr:hypothetical protein [Gammaproteobacteria bacterium]
MRILNVEFNNNKPHQFNAWINQVVVLLVFLCSSGIAQAEWPIEFGNSNHEAVVDSIVDSQGNTIIVGRFNGSTSFKKSDGAELVLNGVAQDDIFVAKFDSSGTFLWAQKAAGTANGRIFKVDVDPSDNVYISGHLFGTASATLSFSSITLNRGKFIAKLDNNGNWLWANSLYVSLGALDLGYTENRSVAISVTGQGLYVAYYDYLNGPNQTVLRFVKFDLDGNELWVYNANTGPVGSTAERVIPVDLEVVSIEDTASDIYLLADRSNSSLVASLTLICGYVLPVNTQNALIKISETITTDLVNGDRTYGHTCDWVTKVGERASNLKQDGGDIEADSTNVYYGVQGRISAYGASNGLELWNYGANAPVWIPDPANNPNTSTTSIAIDAEKNVYISGVYNFVSIFEGDPAVTDHSKLLPWTAQPSLYVAKFLSAEKKWAWVTTTPKPLHYPVIDPFSIRTQISMGPGDATVNLAGNFLGMMDKNVTVNSSGTYNGEMGTDDVGNKRVLTSRALPSDGALDLDGNDDYINLPGTLLNGLNNYAVSFDLRIDPSTPLQAGWSVFSASNGAGQDNEILLWFTSPTNLQIYEKGVIR